MGWFSTLMEWRLLRRGVPLAILVLILGAIAAGTAIGHTATCTNSAATLAGSAFEIDGDANLKVDSGGCIDWLTGPNVSDPFRPGVAWKLDSPSGSTDESFTQGTKEDTADPVVEFGSIPPNKSDLKAFGTFQESGEANLGNPTGKFLELFWSRVQDPSGTTNMDFELNKLYCDPQAPTAATCATNGVTPKRSVNDILITYDLSRGGTRATISIRKWNGSAWGPATVIADSEALGTVNTNLITQSPIVTPQNPTGSLDPRTFGEAAIPFSALFGQNTCGEFGSAYLKSRSSDSFSAALKDFVPPQKVSISNCSEITTDTKDAASVTIGDPISDTATLSGVTENAGGTITFKLYGPDDANCSGAVAFTSTKNVSGPGTYTSDSFTPTAVGTYRWIASYSGDASNTSVSGECNDANESSVVAKRQPAISTDSTDSVTIGGSISDDATLTGATGDAGGTITFKVYGPDDANCSGQAVFTSTRNVSGNGTYTSDAFTPTAVGTYRWIASYSGDAKNLAVSGKCNDANESSVVEKAASSVQTAQSLTPQDTAELSAGAGGTPTGDVTFKLYGPSADPNQPPDCTGDAVYTETVGLTNGSASTSNSSYDINKAKEGTYSWQLIYEGDSTHKPVTSCVEHFTVSITNGGIVTSS